MKKKTQPLSVKIKTVTVFSGSGKPCSDHTSDLDPTTPATLTTTHLR